MDVWILNFYHIPGRDIQHIISGQIWIFAGLGFLYSNSTKAL